MKSPDSTQEGHDWFPKELRLLCAGVTLALASLVVVYFWEYLAISYYAATTPGTGEVKIWGWHDATYEVGDVELEVVGKGSLTISQPEHESFVGGDVSISGIGAYSFRVEGYSKSRLRPGPVPDVIGSPDWLSWCVEVAGVDPESPFAALAIHNVSDAVANYDQILRIVEQWYAGDQPVWIRSGSYICKVTVSKDGDGRDR